MNILFVLKNFSISGGVERVTSRLVNQLIQDGHQVEILIFNKDTASEGSPTFSYKGHGVLDLLKFSLFIRNKIKKDKIDFIISAKEQANFTLFISSLFTDVRCLYVRHSALSSSIGYLYAKIILLIYRMILLRKNNCLGAVSKELSNTLKKKFSKFSDRIYYLPNAVIDEDFFKKSSIDVSKEIRDICFGCIISVGRLIKEKRIFDLIEAYSESLDKVDGRTKTPNLVIVGDGPDLESLKKSSLLSKHSNKIFFLGYQSNPYSLMALADTLVLTSEIEGMPTVLIEALALNKNVISSNCKTGPEELLQYGRYGHLYQVGDTKKLSELLLSTFDSSEKTNTDDVVSQFKVCNSVKNYLRVYYERK